MPWPTKPDPDAGRLSEVRQAGAQAAEKILNEVAPTDVLERVAWTAGAGSFDALQVAVDGARAEGYTWKQVAVALGQNEATVRHKFSPSSHDAQRRYRQRKRGEG